MQSHGRAFTLTLAIALGLAACSRDGEPGNTLPDASSSVTDYPDARSHIRELVANPDKDSLVTLTLAMGDTFSLSAPTVKYYRSLLRRGKPVWTEGTQLLPRGEQLVEALGKAGDDGLDPAAYGHPVALRIIRTLNSSPPDSLISRHVADLDLVLTEGFNRYAMDLTRGTIDPGKVRAWKIPRAKPWEENLLRMMIRGETPTAMVERLRPQGPYYKRMMAAIARHREIQAGGGWPKVTGGKLEPGDSSAAVATLRTRLAASDDPREVTLANAGQARPLVFDDDLRDALRHFQDRHALENDGRLGEATLRELNEPVEARLSEILLNIDRWRWLPHDLGEFYVLVNVAGFELEVVENNVAIERMNVVVGQPGWSTPIFVDTMEHIVVNPSWNVPPSIAEREILPAIARDPDYLAKNNMVRTADGGFRQIPGPDNALGDFKFIFPNKDNIYLHDTPAKSLFSRTRRAFIHGCIRLERPADLAYLIASKATRLSPGEIRDKQRTGEEAWVKVTRTLPVYILYFTVWVDEDGTVRFYHDVYGHDESLQEEATASAAL